MGESEPKNPAARRSGRLNQQPQPTAAPRRFRFGLRTLLAGVTLAAIGSWAYWFGWPWWKEYREQCKFESAVAKLHVGISQYEFDQRPLLTFPHSYNHSVWLDSADDGAAISGIGSHMNGQIART